MASSLTREEDQHKEQDKRTMSMRMPQSQLLTPEEPLVYSFSVPKQSTQALAAVPSPPASPAFRSFSTEAAYQPNDDVLYPDHSNTRAGSIDRPLFESNRLPTPERQTTPAPTASKSVSTSAASQHDSPLQPVQEPAKPAAAGERTSQQPSQATSTGQHPSSHRPVVGVVNLYKTYGLDYYRYILAQNDRMAEQRRQSRVLPPLATSNVVSRDPYTQQILSSLTKSSRVEKPRAAPQSRKVARTAPCKVATRSDVSSAVTATPKHESPAKRNRRPTTPLDACSGAVSQVAQPKPRTRAPPTKKVEGNNGDWANIPDHCPPVSSLDSMHKKLAVQWSNSNALDLSNDPNRMHLHPQELEVAQVLRLKCDAYLANKRRIFAARLHHMQEGKEFNKTSAQNATQIDVNKASRLWAAFDAVGWFDEKWFTPQL